MSKINILQPSVYNLISAGEVVERPAAVVKELVENSIDAGATDITISIKDGGKSKIVVFDNGCGIDKDNLLIAMLPHATSKLSKAEDLDEISTLGFRGEALPSINSVSQITISSRTPDCEVGNCFDANTKTMTQVGMTYGTKIEVSNLFYNTPVRAKFLKKTATEEGFISDIVSKIIFANPSIKFKYISDDKIIFQTLGGMENALYAVYSSDIANNMLPFDYTFNKIRVYGYCGNKDLYKHNKNFQTIIINGRPINNITIQTAVSQAYGNILMKRCYPVFVLNLIMPFDEVDVNVHPTKSEVRFQNNNTVFSCVYRAIQNILNEQEKSLEITINTNIDEHNLKNNANLSNNSEIVHKLEINKLEKSENFSNNTSSSYMDKKNNFKNITLDDISNNIEYLKGELNSISEKNSSTPNGSMVADIKLNLEEFENIEQSKNNFLPKVSENLCYSSVSPTNNLAKDQSFLSNINSAQSNPLLNNPLLDNIKESYSNFKLVGQLFNTYLIIEQSENLFIIDQHAFHERILYDELIKQIDSKSIVSQPLLLPFVYESDHQKFEFLTGILPNLEFLGFEIAEFGGFSLKINAIPFILGDINLQMFFDSLFQEKQTLSVKNNSDLLNDKIASQACKAAIKGGDNLSDNQINSLLLSAAVPSQCPHGRPIIKTFKKSDIEKLFKRIL